MAVTLAECFARYQDTDKNTIHSYAEVYERLLGPYRDRGPLRLLEVGVRGGGSLLAWADWFPGADIFGIDNGSEAGFWTPPEPSNIATLHADSTRPATLLACMAVLSGTDPNWDIVIDDGCHTPLVQVATWAVLFPYVKPGGIYIIEDVEGITHAQALQQLFGAEIIDRRHVKGRHDDILAVWSVGLPLSSRPANPDGEHLAANGRPIDGYPLQQA